MMPQDAKESKAKKLAAARKKLKEYQTKDKRGYDTNGGGSGMLENVPSGATSATLSEKSDSELNLNGNALDSSGEMTPLGEQLEEATAPPIALDVEANVDTSSDTPTIVSGISQSAVAEDIPSAASYFNSLPNVTSLSPTPNFSQILQETSSIATESYGFGMAQPQQQTAIEPHNNLNTIQLLITEKSQLNSELNKFRTVCREHDMEIEELRTEFSATQRRYEELQQHYMTQQKSLEEIRSSNSILQEQLTDVQAKREDLSSHLVEIKLQFGVAQQRLQSLEQQYKEKCNELELSQIRINQLSDESCISKDNRVETLTQTQFMYEQQIRDLQAMVQQLTQDKEQANIQYQNYVQHLNTEVTNLSERNSELTEENSKLQEHEHQLIEHISGLEREIQRNIARQDQFRADEKIKDTSTPSEQEAVISKLKEIISDFDFERHEFQLKIKSQEDRLENNARELKQKLQLIAELEEQLQNINSEQPDKTKLLATMESDKIAASRALTQNVELKKQLDELELRFVQLTNDKAELVNKLDAEEYANREMRNAFAQMEEKLHSIDERFKFKDEEMIRLSHENMDLTRKNLMLQQQVDQLRHYEVREYSERFGSDDESNPLIIEKLSNAKHDHEHPDHDDHEHAHHDHDHHDHNHHDNEHHDHDHHDHDHHDHDHHGHKHNHPQDHSEKHDNYQETENYATHSESDLGQEAKEDPNLSYDQHDHLEKLPKVSSTTKHYHHRNATQQLATTDAVQKLQQRFTQLMSQVADLTEDKQRLEHLVLQLQSETETIGEYITLYQTQRRILKQREYEKAAQMQLLQLEREKMQERISVLNNLVSSLGAELPHNKRIAEHLNSALAESVSIEPVTNSEHLHLTNPTQHQEEIAINQKLNVAESQEILTKIQSIITEIKENTKDIPVVPQLHDVDHLNCCMGKFEVV